LSSRTRGVVGLLVILLAGAGVLAWKRPDLVPFLPRRDSAASTVVTAELADSTLDRFDAFRRGELGEELRLSGPEISSVVRYSFPGLLPTGVHDPNVALEDGRVRLTVRLDVASLPDVPALRDVLGFLPDTVPLEVEGTVTSYGREQALLRIRSMEAAKIPLPSKLYPEILKALGRATPQDAPPGSIVIQLPSGLDSIFVERDSLHLFANPATP
jgi:hypothetical protein